MAQTYWTITYNGTEKTFAAWGLSKVKRRRKNIALSEISAVADGQPIDGPDLFLFQSVVSIQRNRTMAEDGSFSGGSVWHGLAIVTDSHRTGSPSSESVSYVFSNVFWYFQSIFYKQNWSTFLTGAGPNDFVGWTDHVILNRQPAATLNLLSVRGQVQAICDYVLTKMPGAFTYDVSALPNVFPPPDEKRTLTCDEAVKHQMQWVPDGVMRVDETQTPPKIYFTSRYGDTAFSAAPTLQMPRVSLAIGTGKAGEAVEVVSESIKPLYKLQVPQVAFTYEQTKKVNQSEALYLYYDVYPTTTPSPLNVMEQTINLYGYAASFQQGTIESIDLTAYTASDWTDWFTQKHPYLATVAPGTLTMVGGQVYFTDDQNNALDIGTVLGLTPYELLNHGVFHNWMVADGNVPAVKQRVKISAYFAYTDQFGNVVDDVSGKLITSSVDLVNLSPGNYSRLTQTQAPDQVPGLILVNGVATFNTDLALAPQYGLSLAYWFYKILSVLQWEGEVVVESNQSDGEISTTDFMGVALSLANGLAAWSSMDAIVQGVEEDVDAGRVTVSFGQNKLLSAGKLIDLNKFNRLRVFTGYSDTMSNGANFTQQEILSPDATSTQDSTGIDAPWSKFNVTAPIAL